jgi:hypothetical protein
VARESLGLSRQDGLAGNGDAQAVAAVAGGARHARLRPRAGARPGIVLVHLELPRRSHDRMGCGRGSGAIAGHPGAVGLGVIGASVLWVSKHSLLLLSLPGAASLNSPSMIALSDRSRSRSAKALR